MINEDRNNPDEIIDQIRDGEHWEELIDYLKSGRSDFVSEVAHILMNPKPDSLSELIAILEGDIDNFAEKFYD